MNHQEPWPKLSFRANIVAEFGFKIVHESGDTVPDEVTNKVIIIAANDLDDNTCIGGLIENLDPYARVFLEGTKSEEEYAKSFKLPKRSYPDRWESRELTTRANQLREQSNNDRTELVKMLARRESLRDLYLGRAMLSRFFSAVRSAAGFPDELSAERSELEWRISAQQELLANLERQELRLDEVRYRALLKSVEEASKLSTDGKCRVVIAPPYFADEALAQALFNKNIPFMLINRDKSSIGEDDSNSQPEL